MKITSPPFWYDGHAHLADPRLAPVLGGLLAAAQKAGIGGWVQGGVEPEDWRRQRALKAAQPAGTVLTSYGLHPWWIASQESSQVEAGWEELLKWGSEADAVGETGLDRARDRGKLPSYALQKELFRRHLQLAKLWNKPLVLHIVQAHGEALSILKEEGPFPASGLVHSFSENFSVASKYLALGFYLSVGAEATRPDHEKLKDSISRVAADRLIIETDCPDQSPFVGNQRKQGLNEPVFLLAMAEAVGNYRHQSPESVLTQSTENIRKLFSLV